MCPCVKAGYSCLACTLLHMRKSNVRSIRIVSTIWNIKTTPVTARTVHLTLDIFHLQIEFVYLFYWHLFKNNCNKIIEMTTRFPVKLAKKFDKICSYERPFSVLFRFCFVLFLRIAMLLRLTNSCALCASIFMDFRSDF